MKIEIIRDLDQFLALESDWLALFDRVPNAYLAQSFGWCFTGWEIVAKPRGCQLFVVVLRDEGRVVLIWPLAERRVGLFHVLRPLGSDNYDHNNLLVEEDEYELRRVSFVLNELQHIKGVDLLNLLQVRSNTALHQLLSHDFMCEVLSQSLWLWVKALNATGWAGYWKACPSKLRHDIDRRLRRLLERGKVEFEIITNNPPPARMDFKLLTVDPIRFGEQLDWMFKHKRASMKRLNLHNDWLLSDSYREFLRLASHRCTQGCLAIFILTLNGITIAAELSCLELQRIEGMIKTYDMAYAVYAPGQQLVKKFLQWALEQNLEYDMRLGDETYKENWANQRGTVTIFLKPVSWKGQLLAFFFMHSNFYKFIAKYLNWIREGTSDRHSNT
jgi:CelD/BcsL family acetyltransferase involved in cellulose biosynthesis